MATAMHSVAPSITPLDHSTISILRLAEPLLSQPNTPAPQTSNTPNRSSNISTTTAGENGDNPTPASLEADLTHYKELFTKLRFSYVEQMTKEHFLRSVIGSPPLWVSSSENSELEAQLLLVKEQLQAKKLEVASLVTELGQMSRELAGRWSVIGEGRRQLEQLPAKIALLSQEAEQLRDGMEVGVDGEGMNLSLAETIHLVNQRKKEEDALDREIEELEAANERKLTQVGRIESELKPLQAQKTNVAAAANEARRRKEGAASGERDEPEERGRWLRGVERTMRELLEVEG